MAVPSTPKRFGVLGSGEVGQVLAKGLAANGYEVRIGTRSPGKLAAFSKSTGIPEGRFQDIAVWADAVVLAVLGKAALDAVELAGPKNLPAPRIPDGAAPDQIPRHRLRKGVQ